MSQPRASRTSRLRPIALKLSLPAYDTRYPLGLWHIRLPSTCISVCLTLLTPLPLVASVVPCGSREIVEVPLRRGVRCG